MTKFWWLALALLASCANECRSDSDCAWHDGCSLSECLARGEPLSAAAAACRSPVCATERPACGCVQGGCAPLSAHLEPAYCAEAPPAAR